MKKIFCAVTILGFLSLISCEKALEEKPYSFISAGDIGTTTEADAELWVNGCLNQLNSFFIWGEYNRPLEVDADEATGKDYAFSKVGAGNFVEVSDLNTFWKAPYTLIQRCDYAISNLNKFSIDEAAKNNALGQVYFLKSWAYFMLVRAFGEVPVFKEPVIESGQNNQPRQSIPEVYAYIIENLKLAEEGLYSRNDANWKLGRVSKEAAKTLLAKVYLTMASGSLSGAQVTVKGGPQTRDNGGTRVYLDPSIATYTKEVVAGYEGFNATQYFTLARDKAQEVVELAGGMYEGNDNTGLFPSYPEVWSQANHNKREHLWSMNPISGDETFGNFFSQQYTGTIQSNGSITGNIIGMSDHWYQLFENDIDQRVRWGVIHRFRLYTAASWQFYPAWEATSPKKDFYGFVEGDNTARDQFHFGMLTKYSIVTDRTLNRADVYYPLLRYAETLLILAEAENEINGPSSVALSALNAVRTRSGASLIEAVSSEGVMEKPALRSIILEERQRELALEGSRRWDLLRWGIYLPVMNAIGVDANGIIKRRERRNLLFPLPLVEINGNSAITENNPGW
ncbi:RagB/SusD family nutrient uptake outer membrane protein [Desertivirga xinjiangensis]|uniref:RagB/SusD family nutrient uptake outer membrane protein n=1 Tax=Desertivirga xinjiangensis TaxID=539206 RepID=UPI00210C4417|nr:RagB/SusD family nutrient uptake outer membrane protein [Pedobacter xinjiangensis]